MIKKEYREEIYLIALVLLGLYLSLIENIIPKPFPWMKIGLSNISVLIALEKFNSKMALQTILLRVFIQALMLGTLFTPNFIISFSAGLVSTLFMIFLYKFRNYLSLLMVRKQLLLMCLISQTGRSWTLRMVLPQHLR